ncbi:MocR-like pyridoxine biosynthesis transcription factor PdxR [Gracilibacillus sp. HCP3S3_G5_1]|uniref:MocR-like pyridoxine biosynthesis transcription factor PdxR n=1 Tax=unclassified Gracilibacillus TaxID=2625209 RepID=UPI003F887D1F
MFEITPKLDPNDNTPLYIQLYEYILEEIEAGRISQGTRLPSIRKLASHLEISKNTVDAAYQQLIAEGYIKSKPKSGLYVTEFDEQFLIPSSKTPITLNNCEVYKTLEKIYPYDFRHGNIDKESFPTTIWKKLNNQVLYEKDIFSYGDRQGEPELRLELTKYLYESRGVLCTPDQIIIGGGIQQLLGLLCIIIGSDFHSIAVENPGYDGTREIFKHHGFSIKPIELNNHGIHIKKLRESQARLVYVTPSHQFPIGMIMPITNRMKLIQWAEHVNGYIIEDDYDSEFRYRGKPIPALQGIDSQDKVIYLGTFSKALLPSIRLAYMILPEPLIKKFKMKFQFYEQPVSKILQKTIYLFMQQGYWQKHLRKMRHIYQKKHEALYKSVHEFMGTHVKIIGEDSGLHLLLEVKSSNTEEILIERAKQSGVKVYPTSKYWMNKNHSKYPKILIGFAGLKEDEMVKGIKLLSEAWFS